MTDKQIRANIALALHRWTRYPSRPMIVKQNGDVYWPQPNESALPGEVLLGPFNEVGPYWGTMELMGALRRVR